MCSLFRNIFLTGYSVPLENVSVQWNLPVKGSFCYFNAWKWFASLCFNFSETFLTKATFRICYLKLPKWLNFIQRCFQFQMTNLLDILPLCTQNNRLELQIQSEEYLAYLHQIRCIHALISECKQLQKSKLKILIALESYIWLKLIKTHIKTTM